LVVVDCGPPGCTAGAAEGVISFLSGAGCLVLASVVVVGTGGSVVVDGRVRETPVVVVAGETGVITAFSGWGC